MKLLITGACGFVGHSLIRAIREAGLPWTISGFDNLTRPGSELNRPALREYGVQFIHGDLRCQSDVDSLPPVDWILDAAANPSVLAGVVGPQSSRQLMEHNLLGTVNLLERCRAQTGFVLLSTSRVYSIPPLARLPVEVHDRAFRPVPDGPLPAGMSGEGVSENFRTSPPLSLYGATKLASETLALEYGAGFGFPVWINRCGVLAGAGQFGRADQGIFAYWIHAQA
jgi:CDP-paratose 2-epimerase